MTNKNGKIAGLLAFVSGVICVLGIIVAEALYPGYSTSENYISDLGVGPSALIFNSSLILFGLLIIASAYFVDRAFGLRIFTVLVVMAGVGAIGVGLFPEDVPVLHFVFSVIVFTFGGLSAIASYKLQKAPFSHLSVILGVTSLMAMVLFGSGNSLGLGVGGMERMIAYPELLWVVGFGGYLFGHCVNKSESAES